MAAIWTLMAMLGLEGIFRLFPWAYMIARIVGALYLLYITWTTWRGAKNPIKDTSKPKAHAFREGLLINLSNPKSVLFAAAILIVIFPPDMTLLEKGFVVVNHFVVEVLFYGILAQAMSTQAVAKSYQRAKIHLDRFAAIVLGALGLRLLFQR